MATTQVLMAFGLGWSFPFVMIGELFQSNSKMAMLLSLTDIELTMLLRYEIRYWSIFE